MACFNGVRGSVLVASTILTVCMIFVSFVQALSATDFSTAEQTNTLQFLQSFASLNPPLAALWTGSNFCGWKYVSCWDAPYLDFAYFVSDRYADVLVLPELGDDVDGSSVIFAEIKARGMGANLTGTLPASWSRLTRLTTLYLDGNALTGTLPAAWAALPSLTTLHVENNGLEGSLPSTWEKMTSAAYFFFNHNALTGTLPATWGTMTKLWSLNLQDNELSGSLPASWSGMTSLNRLNLTRNALSGTLPSEWAALPSLTRLEVANNHFSGSIPAEWGAWSTITADLSGNSLCGCLPAGWSSFSLVRSVTVDAAVSAADCAAANTCVVQPSSTSIPSTTTTSTTTTSTSAPPAELPTQAPAPRKSGPNLVPLWCVLGVVCGLLVAAAIGVVVYCRCRRQRHAEEVKRFQASEGKEEEPFAQTPDSPY